MTRALDAQVGGNHYKKGIQPFQLSMANQHDGCTHAIQKYLTRFERESGSGIKDLKKAHHIAQIRVDTMADYGVFHPPAKPLILIGDYLRSNEAKAKAAAAITAMEQWFRTVDTDHQRQADKVRRLIRETAKHHYPDQYNREDFI